ncbi:MAG: endonuclease/exonuclease/phosphatase family protein [Planctomycetes bacterium]|nr:endonuclease/exonuclease/phosphatase family protein [Planctomycetota bacterium]
MRLKTRLDYELDKPLLDGKSDFSIQFWVRTTADSTKRMVLLSKKDFTNNTLYAQRRPGWVFYMSHGTWAWNMGSGSRRITYERDNGRIMRLNDGRWHQLTMTYDGAQSNVRLYFDGRERAMYNLADANGFDFANASPLAVGWKKEKYERHEGFGHTVEGGAGNLQELVDAFNDLGIEPVQSDEFTDLIVDPTGLFNQRVQKQVDLLDADGATALLEAMALADLGPLKKAESVLMRSPYTVHQNRQFTDIAPVTKLYALENGRVIIRDSGAKAIAARERLDQPDFEIDNLAIWNRVLSRDEVGASYARHFEAVVREPQESIPEITAAAWNIEHGGLHFTMAEHGWDSRLTIAEMIRSQGIDVVMMQETYSSGDFIAAELGYYFAEGVDWDYINQGANISVLSRYPIEELHVPASAPFSNLAVKVKLSKTQDMHVMSNWYGMNKFPAVMKFHGARFDASDVTPTLFAGDFNAIPHTDGGDSPASRQLLESGFVDAYRSLHKIVKDFPGATHADGQRIDQLYYKGAGLTNTSTKIISSWPTGFPSDHYLLVSSFDLKTGQEEARK